MGYNKDDELCINTIRLLAVCTLSIAPLCSYGVLLALFFLSSSPCPTIFSMASGVDCSCCIGRCHFQSQFRPSRSPYGACSSRPRSVQQIYEVQFVFEHVLQIYADTYNSFNPQNTDWLNRDRFILSNGHACMLQYALLHLFGYKVTIDDIKAFRVSFLRSHIRAQQRPDK